MNSEEPIQLESSVPASSSDGYHDTQQVQTALEPTSPSTVVSEHVTTELASHIHHPDLSATVEGEVESTTLLERTLVEGDEADASTKKHIKGPSDGDASKKSRDSHSTRRSVEGGSSTPWHPLEVQNKGGETQGDDQVFVEGDVVDSKGKLSYPQTDLKTSSNRTSHLYLDLKPSSPHPWDHIDPPLENNLRIKSKECSYSPSAAQPKFHTMQKARHVFFFLSTLSECSDRFFVEGFDP